MYSFFEKCRYFFGFLIHRLVELGAALIWPVNRAFGAITWLVMMRADHFEDLLHALGRVLTWPFRVLGHGFLTVARWLLFPWSRLANTNAVEGMKLWLLRVGYGFLKTIESEKVERPIRVLTWFLQPVWRPVVAVGGFFFSWIATRNYRQMLWGLPALLMFMPFLFMLGKTLAFGNNRLAGQYQVAVKKALEANDHRQVQLYERKLVQLGVDTKLTDFRTAERLALDGKVEEAYQRMQRLAPLKKPGHPSAHFWILQRLLNGELEESQEDAIRLAEIHLRHIETLGIRGPSIQRMRIYWLIEANRLAEAADLLKPLAIEDWDAAAQRMSINLSLQRHDQARRDARLVCSHCQDHQRKNSHITSQEYESWAMAESVLGNTANLKTILLAWLELEPNNLKTRQSLEKINLLQFGQILNSAQPNEELLAEMLIESEQTTTDHKMLNQFAKEILAERVPIRVFRHIVESLFQTPQTPVTIYVMLGSTAASTDELELAKALLERALELDESRVATWNNYAWVLSHGTSQNLDHALDAVNRALEIARDSPDELPVRETRGQILASLERWPEAILDLQYALNRMPENKEIHQALADAYSALGQGELAQMHRVQAD